MKSSKRVDVQSDRFLDAGAIPAASTGLEIATDPFLLGGSSMKTEVMGDRGFRALRHPVYPAESLKDADDRIASESSAIGDYIDSMDRP